MTRTRLFFALPSAALSFVLFSLPGITASARGQELLESSTASAASLPDDPSTVFSYTADSESMWQEPGSLLPPPCRPNVFAPYGRKSQQPKTPQPQSPCIDEHPLRIVVNAENRRPLTARQKGELAIRDFIDPVNLGVIGLEAGIGVAANSHSAYGPGFKGFGKLYGYQLLQDAQGEFIGTFAIPAIVHEDPRYRRMENAPVKRRILHALSHTIIAEHDDGRAMPNYATLLTYPISAELSNLYVPGVQSNAPSTIKRIAIGYASDPAGNLISEFLPDLARRIHVRSVFIQQIVNSVALNPTMGGQ